MAAFAIPATLWHTPPPHHPLVVHEVDADDAQSHSLNHCNRAEAGRSQFHSAAPAVVDHLNP